MTDREDSARVARPLDRRQIGDQGFITLKSEPGVVTRHAMANEEARRTDAVVDGGSDPPVWSGKMTYLQTSGQLAPSPPGPA